MYDKDLEFAERVRNSKCFCLPHFSDLLDYAGRCIPENKQQEFQNIGECHVSSDEKRLLQLNRERLPRWLPA